MKPEFPAAHLRCPVCRSERSLTLQASESDAREVREGTLRCSACQATFPVHRGVAHLLHDPPGHVTREAAGLGRFAEVMRASGWDAEKIRQLPDIDDGYWYVQAQSMHQLLSTVDFRPGDWILDVGSNTCWASSRFARHGLNAIALDISTPELQGLYTADYFIAEGISYFERVLGSMNDMPLASESLDFVFCCEVLHHNDPQGLRRTFAEIFRVLKPGGRLLMVNETLKTRRDPVGVHVEGVEQFEGYEHAHWAAQYRWEAIRAGFATQLIEPSYHWFFRERPAPRVAEALRRGWRERHSPAGAAKSAALQTARGTALGRRAYLAWVLHVAGGTQMSMIATKPLRLLGSPSASAPERVARSLGSAASASLRAAVRGLRRPAARPG